MTTMTPLTPGELSVIGGRAAVLVHIADDAMRAHDWDHAHGYYLEARDLTSLLAFNSGKMHYIALSLARIEFHKGNFAEALGALENLVPDIDWLMPCDIEIMAVCNEKLGNDTKARKLHQAAIDAQEELESF